MSNGRDHEPSEPPAHGWHGRLSHVRGDALSDDTTQTSGMRRRAAISGVLVGSEKIWMGETHVAAGVVSADHHHGESETAIYVMRGHPEFVFLADGHETRIATEPGDYVFVPPYAAHREENPTGEEAVVVIARSTQEAIVVNLETLQGPEVAR